MAKALRQSKITAILLCYPFSELDGYLTSRRRQLFIVIHNCGDAAVIFHQKRRKRKMEIIIGVLSFIVLGVANLILKHYGVEIFKGTSEKTTNRKEKIGLKNFHPQISKIGL
ncbi:MAG: hypothetical protein IPH12_16380 [Saprospirales bacterium]|nr:hypothetical protein [Saprospirales bacterium]